MPIQHIFLDDGGVMNDNVLRGPQWQRLVGEFFAPRLGGEPGVWAAANRDVLAGVDKRYQDLVRDWDGSRSYRDVLRSYELDWLDSMARAAAVALSGSDDERYELSLEAQSYILPRVRSSLPGVSDAVRELYLGYSLYTASGETSRELAGYLAGMGIDEIFQGLYGPDLVDQPKIGPEYYRRIFAHAGVEPATALVVDDRASCLAWVREVGARAILVSPGRQLPGVDGVVASLRELPGLIIAKGL